MRILMVLCLVGCAGESEIEIVSPKQGDLIPTTGNVTLMIDGHHLEMAAGERVTVNGNTVNATQSGADLSTCDSCRFTMTFSAAGLSPITATIRVAIEYDLSDIAEDEVTVNFVSP